jgi:hypothetical protein
MGPHSVPAESVKRDQVDQLAQAALNDGTVKPYRRFMNLAEGKIVCVMEVPSKEELASWSGKMGLPCDHIVLVELEGERGNVS